MIFSNGMKFFKSTIVIVSIVVLVAGGFAAPKKANAVVLTLTTFDTPRTLQQILDAAAWMVAKILVQKLTQQIVSFIRSGGQGGGALFVQNWQGFALNAADQASGLFLKELKLTSLCEPFAPRLRLIFASGRQSLQDRYRCTVSTIASNVQSFFDNFNNGGWQRWFEITQVPSNNPYGAYYSLLEEKQNREAISVQASLNKAISANGFLGVEECGDPQTISYVDSDTGETISADMPGKCNIVSPGKYLENRLAEATNSDIKQLNLADSFNEIIMAAFQAIIQNLFFSSGGLTSGNVNSSSINSQTQGDLNAVRQSVLQTLAIDSATSTIQSIIAVKEDSSVKLTNEVQTLNQLQTCAQNKSSFGNVRQRVSSASSALDKLNKDLTVQKLFLLTLRNDYSDLLNAQSIGDFQRILSKTQSDIQKVGLLSDATAENDKITADKATAEANLTSCLGQ